MFARITAFVVFAMAWVSISSISATLYFPQVADGGGYRTTFTIFNPTAGPVTGTLAFFHQDGSSRALKIGDSTNSWIIVTLPSMGTTRLTTSGESAATTSGWAKFDCPSTVQGVATFELRNHGDLATLAAVLGTQPVTRFVMPVNVAARSNSGFAVVNPGADKPVRVVFTAFDEGGRGVYSGTMASLDPLGPLAQVADFITSAFPGIPSDFKGSLLAEVAGEGSMVATGLNVQEGLLSTIPVLDAGDLSLIPAGPFGIEFVAIPAGEFVMGDDNGFLEDERPAHRVVISKPFQLGRYEVTVEQWTAVMGSGPPCPYGDLSPQSPVSCVGYDSIQAFITKLNALNDGYRYRLPTEAEWEYAARAGTTGTHSGNVEEMAWFGDINGQPQPVGQKKPNPWGLYDIYGNVWEWVQDVYSATYYSASPTVDPQGPEGDPEGSVARYPHVVRGGSRAGPLQFCSSIYRFAPYVGYRGYLFGFRLARVAR